MFNGALGTNLRGLDLVELKISNVDVERSIRLRSTVMTLTGRPIPCEITEPAEDALAGDYVAFKLAFIPAAT